MAKPQRFIGVLTEHFAGNFPLWLAPVQAIVLSISEKTNEYAAKVASELREAGLRVESNLSGEKIGAKIRDASLQKIPYQLVVGQQEAEAGKVAVRHRNADQGAMGVAEFIRRAQQEITSKGVAPATPA